MTEEEKKKEKGLIPLKEAEKYCDYSADYLKLRARQGKLKAEKMGRAWVTTKEWIKEYEEKMEEYWELRNDGLSSSEACDEVFEEKEELEVVVRERKVPEPAPSFPVPSFARLAAGAAPLILALLLLFGSTFVVRSLHLSYTVGQGRVAEEPRLEGPEYLREMKKMNESLGSAAFSFERLVEDIPSSFSRGSREVGWYLSYEARTFAGFGRWMSQTVKGAVSPSVSRFSFLRLSPFQDLPSQLSGAGESALFFSSVQSAFQKAGGRMIAFFHNLRFRLSRVFAGLFRAPLRAARGVKNLFARGAGKIASLFRTRVAEKEPAEKPSQPEQPAQPTKEGIVVIPPKLRDKNMEKMIKRAFSDEVIVKPEDERTGVVRPVFKEGAGEEYRYMLVPITED